MTNFLKRTIVELKKDNNKFSPDLNFDRLYNLFGKESIDIDKYKSGKKLIDSLKNKIKLSSQCMSFSAELSNVNKDFNTIREYIEKDDQIPEGVKNVHFFSEFLSSILSNGFLKSELPNISDGLENWILNSEYSDYYKLLIETHNSTIFDDNGFKFYGVKNFKKAKKVLCIVSRDFSDLPTNNFLSQIRHTKNYIINNLEYYETLINSSHIYDEEFMKKSIIKRSKREQQVEIVNSQEIHLANLNFSNYDIVFFIGHGNNFNENGGFIYHKAFKETINSSFYLEKNFLKSNIPENTTLLLFSCSIEPYKDLPLNFKYFGQSYDDSSYFEFQEMFFYGFLSSLLINNDVELSIRNGLLCSEFKTLNNAKIYVTRRMEGSSNARSYSRILI